MKFADMLTCPINTLRDHYVAMRNLSVNNSRIAQSTRPGSRTRGRAARQMGYLMRQVEMCERAADKRGIRL